MKKLTKHIYRLLAFVLLLTSFSVPTTVPTYAASSDAPGLKLDIKQPPNGDAEYINSGSQDPWQGGQVRVYVDGRYGFSDEYKGFLGFPDLGKIYTDVKAGIASNLRIELPAEITGPQFINSLDETKSYIKIDTGTVNFSKRNLQVDANNQQVIYLTFRANDNQGFIDNLFSLITNLINIIFGKQIVISYVLTANVADLNANGMTSDLSPNKIITKGKLPPQKDKKLLFKTTLYSYYDLDQNSMPKPGNSGGYTSNEEIATWNSYIAPWDNKDQMNTQTAEYTEELGKTTTLPGTVGNRNVTLDYRKDGLFEKDVARFDRVVNYFSHLRVANTALTHTPTSIPLGTKQAVKYAGSAEGTNLSPVTVNIDQRYRPIELTPTDTSNLYQLNDLLNYSFNWKGLDSDNGTIYYTLNGVKKTGKNYTNLNPGTVYTGEVIGEKLVKEGKNTIKVYMEDYNKVRSNELTFDFYVFRSLPTYNSKMTIRSLANSDVGESATVGQDEPAEVTAKFIQTNDKELIKPVLRTTLPTNVTKIANTTKLIINNKTFPLPDTVWQGQALSVVLDSYINQAGGTNGTLPGKVDNQIQLIYQAKSSILGEYTINPVTLEGSPTVSIPDKPILAKTGTNQLVVSKLILKFEEVPTNLSYGINKIPAEDTVYQTTNAPKFTIKDTTNTTKPWSVVLKVSQPLTANNQKLAYQFIYKDGKKNIPIDPLGTTIFTNSKANNGIVDLGWNDSKQVGLDLKIKSDQQFIKDQSYTGELTWNINITPTP